MPFDFDRDPVQVSGLFPNTTAPVQVDVYGYCQMACFYCFANLNKTAKGREVNEKSSLPAALRALDRHLADPESLIGWLLREKYFVGFSNTTDPFQRAEKTHRASEAILKWLRANDQPVFIETKGNVLYEQWDRYADLLNPARTVAYVSLSMLDDRLRKRLEPGALDVAGRLDLMHRLADRGVAVVAGCNPYARDWCPDMEAYCRAVKDAGASAVFAFPLHLTSKQAAVIPEFYAAEVEKANLLPGFEHQVFAGWREATAKYGLYCSLAPYWDAVFGYPSRENAGEAPTVGRGREFLWPHQFMAEVDAYSRCNSGRPVLFSWQTVQHFLRARGLPNVLLKTAPFDQTWLNCTDAHKAFRAGVPATAGFYDVLRWAFSTPWITQRVIWIDPHTRALYDRSRSMYEADANDDLIAAYLPRQAGREELMIARDEFAFDDVIRMYPPAGESSCEWQHDRSTSPRKRSRKARM